jgi:transcriptional regulator GlxA family with amidase domain
MKTHVVAFFAFDGFQLLDVTGPASAFGVANSIAGNRVYEIQVVSPAGGPVESSCGVSLHAQALAAVNPRSVHTLLVAGGSTAAMQKTLEASVARQWLPRCIRASERFGSVCAGAFILAELGVLENLRVATHWARCDDLAKRFPKVFVDSDSLFIVDGKVWTSAGVSTGLDMALAMVERDIGRPFAAKIAKFLVLYARRPGYQSQFSDLLKAQASSATEFAELAEWMQDRLAQTLDVPTLAAKAGLSERTFYRKFVEATGNTPAKFVENVRLDAARALLSTSLPLKTIAAQTGMGSTARLTAAFERRFGVTLALFRQMH